MTLRAISSGPVLRFDLAAAARGWLPPLVSEAFCIKLGNALQMSVREAGAPASWIGGDGALCHWPDTKVGPVVVLGPSEITKAVVAALGAVALQIGLSAEAPVVFPIEKYLAGHLQSSRFVIGTAGRRFLLGAPESVVMAWWDAVESGESEARLRAQVEALVMPTQVELGRRQMSLTEVSKMAVGDVLLLGSAQGSVKMKVAGVPRFLVAPVHKNGQVGARVTEVLGSAGDEPR